MSGVDPEIKNLRIYVDHQLNNLRMGVEYLTRTMKTLRNHIEVLEKKVECRLQQNTETFTDKPIPKKSPTVMEIKDTPLPEVNCLDTGLLGSGSVRLTPYETETSHPKLKKF